MPEADGILEGRLRRQLRVSTVSVVLLGSAGGFVSRRTLQLSARSRSDAVVSVKQQKETEAARRREEDQDQIQRIGFRAGA